MKRSDLGQVSEPLLKDSKKPAFGTDLEQASKALSAYEAKMPRMLAGIQSSKAKAGDKKKDGVDYAKAVHETKNNPEPGQPFLSDSNTKLVKDGIISFNIPAGHSCPGK